MTEDGQKIIEEIKARRENGGTENGHDIAKNTKEAIDLKKAEGNIEIALTKAKECSKEVAGKHLAKMGAFYLLVLVLSFIYSVQSLPAEAVAVVAGLITLVVTSLSGILKTITETKEEKDPIELMYDIAEKNSLICQQEHEAMVAAGERQHSTQVQAAERQNTAQVEAGERQLCSLVEASRDAQKDLINSFERSQKEMVMMLKQAQEKQPTSLSIKPDDVVIQQGDNIVSTSTKSK